MEENIKQMWLSKIKTGKVAVVDSWSAPLNTNCIWLKDGVMYVYGNTGWESLGTGGGGGVIKLPVQFNTIETTGGGEDPQEPILNSVNPTRGDTKAGSTVYFCKQKVSGDLFGPTANGLVLDLAYYDGGGNPEGSDTKATKAGLDDIFHQYYVLGTIQSVGVEDSQSFLQALGLTDDPSAKLLVSWRTEDMYEHQGPRVISLIYKSSNYLYIVDMNTPILAQYYNDPDFRGITIMEHEEEEGAEEL